MADEDPLILDDNALAQIVYGENDRNLRKLEQQIGVRIQARGNRVRVSGPALESKVAPRVIRDLYDLAGAGAPIEDSDLRQAVRMAEEPGSEPARALASGSGIEVGRRKRILPRTETQRIYLETIAESSLTFGIGPAGTGAASEKKEIKVGMTPLEVIDVLGQPQKEVSFQNQQKWTYPDLTVIFENGNVKEVRF